MEKKGIKKAESIFSYIAVSIGWIIIFSLILTYYLHPVLAVKQAYRRTIGWDGLIESDSYGVKIVAEEIKRRGVAPINIGYFIRNNMFPWEDDYVVWGIVDYWATPSEMIEKGNEDCDGLAILTKSVSDYLDKDEYYKKQQKVEVINTTIKEEPRHLYTETNGVEDYKLNTKELPLVEGLFNQWNNLPKPRKIVFLIISPLIFLRRLFGIKW